MRVIRLGKIAAQAEKLRLSRLVRRQAIRAGMAAGALVFVLAVFICLHIAGALALTPSVGPLYAVLIVAAVDLVLAGGLGFMAASSTPGSVEQEAFIVREEARAQLAEAAVMTAIIGPMLRRAGIGLLDRLLRGRGQRRVS